MNDRFWGLNFTDWVTTRQAKPLFDGHKQPFLPLDSNYYDLSDLSVLKKQSVMAKNHGIDGFGVYHYHFKEGVRALWNPIHNLRRDPDIEIEYFICWVNANWTKSWVGDDQTTIYKQFYDQKSIKSLAEDCCNFFSDQRYYKINDKPLFYIHDPSSLDLAFFKDTFLSVTQSYGFDDVRFCSPQIHVKPSQVHELDYLLGFPPGDMPSMAMKAQLIYRFLLEGSFKKNILLRNSFRRFSCFSFDQYSKKYTSFVKKASNDPSYIPTILSGWDNTPRYGDRGFLFEGFNSRSFKSFAKDCLVESYNRSKEFFMIKAWNEWAEGNVLEPSVEHGSTILKAFAEAKTLAS